MIDLRVKASVASNALLVGGLLLVSGCSGDDAPREAHPTDAGPDSADVDASYDSPYVCTPGELTGCYDGPPSTDGLGRCHGGARACGADGSGYGECVGQVLPAVETCATTVDDDCDGEVNEDGPDCACAPGSTKECYSAAADTLGVGACKSGTQVCKPDGQGYGPCFGEITPTVETCTTTVDDDCDGQLNEEGADCTCVPNASESCYSGPPATAGVGACTAGTRSCNALGTGWSACIGEVLPESEACATPVDDDCDGQANEEGADCACTPGSTVSCYSGPLATLGVGACSAGTQTCNALGSGYSGCQGEVTPTAENCATYADEDCDAAPECSGDAVWAFAQPNMTQLLAATAIDGASLIAKTGSPGSETITWLELGPNGVPTQLANLPAGSMPRQLSFWPRALAGTYEGQPNFGTGPLPLPSTSLGSFGLFVAVYNSPSSIAWVKGFPGTAGGPGFFPPVFVSARNGPVVLIAAASGGPVDLGAGLLSGAGAFISALSDKVTPSTLWSRRLQQGGTGSVQVSGVQVYEFDALVAGQFTGAVDFGTGTLTSAGGDDVFVMLLEPGKPTIKAVKQFGGWSSESVITGTPYGPGGAWGFPLGITTSGTDFGGGTVGPGAYVVVLSDTGSYQWATQIGSCSPRALTSDTISVYCVAECYAPTQLGSALLPSGKILVQLSTQNGAIVSSRPLPDLTDVHLDKAPFDSALYLSGYVNGTVNFGTGTGSVGPGVVVVKLVP